MRRVRAGGGAANNKKFTGRDAERGGEKERE
jgi:hypothetical protein